MSPADSSPRVRGVSGRSLRMPAPVLLKSSSMICESHSPLPSSVGAAAARFRPKSPLRLRRSLPPPRRKTRGAPALPARHGWLLSRLRVPVQGTHPGVLGQAAADIEWTVVNKGGKEHPRGDCDLYDDPEVGGEVRRGGAQRVLRQHKAIPEYIKQDRGRAQGGDARGRDPLRDAHLPRGAKIDDWRRVPWSDQPEATSTRPDTRSRP